MAQEIVIYWIRVYGLIPRGIIFTNSKCNLNSPLVIRDSAYILFFFCEPRSNVERRLVIN